MRQTNLEDLLSELCLWNIWHLSYWECRYIPRICETTLLSHHLISYTNMEPRYFTIYVISCYLTEMSQRLCIQAWTMGVMDKRSSPWKRDQGTSVGATGILHCGIYPEAYKWPKVRGSLTLGWDLEPETSLPSHIKKACYKPKTFVEADLFKSSIPKTT